MKTRKKITAIFTFYVILLSFLFQASFSYSQSTATISNGLFQVDNTNKIAVINQNLNTVNAQIQSGDCNKIVLNGTYNLAEPTNGFQYNVNYSVTKESNGQQYALFFTKLPIVHINTDTEIVDKNKVYSSFYMSESNHNITMQPFAGASFHGNYSLYPDGKKSYKLEFWNDPNGIDTKNIPLLGMRNDDDWIIQSLVSEPLRINDKVGFELWNEIDTLYYQDLEPDAFNGVQFEFIDFFLNGKYLGVYGLSERIDRKQLKLTKTIDQTIYGELYKGKGNNGAASFSESPAYDNSSTDWSDFKYEYPDDDVIIDWSNLYEYVSFVVNASDADFIAQYTNHLAVKNAVNYFIFVNLTRAKSNLGNNWFIAKYDAGEPYFIVPWDLDATFGLTGGANYEGIIDDIVKNNLFKRLLTDCSPNGFVEQLKSTWNALREDVITHDHIMDMFLTHYNHIEENGGYKREEIIWGDATLPPNQLDYDQLDYISDWLEHRLGFLDGYFAQDCETLNISTESIDNIKLYPNPAFDLITVQLTQDEQIEIYDAMGNNVEAFNLKKGDNQLNISHLSNGLYFLKTNSGARLKFVKN